MNSHLVCKSNGAAFFVLGICAMTEPGSSPHTPALAFTIGAAALGFGFAKAAAAKVFSIIFDVWTAIAAALAPSAAALTQLPGGNTACLMGFGLAIACGLATLGPPEGPGGDEIPVA